LGTAEHQNALIQREEDMEGRILAIGGMLFAFVVNTGSAPCGRQTSSARTSSAGIPRHDATKDGRNECKSARPLQDAPAD
jgi:hypothetical protein